MATTTNYGWTTPDDTALVKDGAAAIRSLGSAIDSTLKTQIDAQIPDSIMDAKGDLISATAADTPARLASSGVNGDVLQVDTSTATGLKWAAPASGGMTLISTTTLSGASITLSSIPSTYNHLFLVMRNYCPATNAMPMQARFNGDSGANRYVTANGTANPAAFGATAFNIWRATQTNTAANCNQVTFGWVYDYLDTNAQKVCLTSGWGLDSDNVTQQNNAAIHLYNQKVAINSITLLPQSGNFTSGTVLLYGVK